MDEYNFDIEKELSSIRENLNDLVKEQRITNALLRIIVTKQNAILPESFWPYAGRSFSVIYHDYSKVADLVFELAKKDGKRFAEFDGESLSALSQAICALKNDDYLLIKNDDLLKLPGSEDLICKAHMDNKIAIIIGKGNKAKEIILDTPDLNYIVFSNIRELIPLKLLELFPTINADENAKT